MILNKYRVEFLISTIKISMKIIKTLMEIIKTLMKVIEVLMKIIKINGALCHKRIIRIAICSRQNSI